MTRSLSLALVGVLALSAAALAQDLDPQVRRAEAAVKENPGDVDALCGLASLYRRAGRLDDALKTSQRAVATDEESVQAHHQLALTYKARGECDKCIPEWEKVLALDPTFYKAHYNIGVAHHDWAQQLLDEAEKLRAGRRRRQAAEKAGEARPHIQKARESWLAALKIKPDHAPSNYNLGVVMHHEGKHDEAIGYYRRAIELNPKHVKACVNLGLCLARRNEAVEAVKLWERAGRLSPGLFEPPYNLGVIYAQMGRPKDAIVQWENARDVIKPQFDAAEKKKIEPLRTQLAADLANCYYNIGVAFEMQKDFKRAQANLKDAVRINPDMDEAWQMLRSIQRRGR